MPKNRLEAIYWERNQLVVFLTKLFPSYLALHTPTHETWGTEWRYVVIVETPRGQLSWHIHESEKPYFDHLEIQENTWDGHTTEKKYQRLLSLSLKDVLKANNK